LDNHELNILLIEDNLSHAEIIKRNLMNQPVKNTIFHLSDGEKAIEYLMHKKKYKNISKYPTPHLVLLDLRLPKVDGIEVLKFIKTSKELKRIPVIILTSSNASKDMVEAYTNLANSYLVKPIDFDQFSFVMSSFASFWFNYNEKYDSF